MVRRVLTDEIWEQLQTTLRNKGCHRWSNDRQVMEAILWKLHTGGPWRDIPAEFYPWKTAYNRFNRWARKGLWEKFFLSYEAMLTRNGYSPTEVTFALISMQVELGVEKKERLENLVEDQQLRFICSPTRMDVRSILKSLGVTYTRSKPPTLFSEK